MPRAIGTALLLLVCAATSVRGDQESSALIAYHDKVDKSVEKGLEYLAKQQVTPEKAKEMNKPYLVGSFASHEQGNTGIASLCVMAFLSKGYLPGSEPHGDLINAGIDYVLAQQHENGLLVNRDNPGSQNGWMYSHSIATLMLAETSGMVDPVRQSKIDEVLPKAFALLLNAQQIKKDDRNAGGCRYTPDSRDSDLSLTGWAIMALRAGKLNGAFVPQENIDGAVRYILKCRMENNGGFGYQPGNGATVGLTGCALLCLTLCGEHKNPVVLPAGDYLLKNIPDRNDSQMKSYYAYYYCSQAAFQLGSRYWETWAPKMYDLLIASQKENGSWEGNEIGPTYNTAMSVLAMTVAYRQLPIYQRDDSFEEE